MTEDDGKGVLVTYGDGGDTNQFFVDGGKRAEIEILSKEGARKLTVFDGSSDEEPVAGVTVGPHGVLTWEAQR